MKKCCACGILQPIEEFTKLRNTEEKRRSCCKKCANARVKSWRERNRQKISEDNKKYREKNLEYILISNKIWAENNPEKHRESLRKSSKKYRLANREKCTAWTLARKIAKKNAMPKWLTKEHLDEINDFFIIANMFKIYSGIPYHVDHIIPLVNDKVCGLHVPWNLQILPASENIRKSNKLLEEYLQQGVSMRDSQ